jgi:hypothetical protein
LEVAFETINAFLGAHRYAARLASNSVRCRPVFERLGLGEKLAAKKSARFERAE